MPLFQTGCTNSRHAEGYEWASGKKIDVFLNTGQKTIRLYLDDGELIEGSYTYDSNAQFSFGTGVVFGGGGIAGGVFPSLGIDGKTKIYSMLRSKNKPALMIEIVADYNRFDGTGQGEARTNDGRSFKLVFGR